MEKVRQSAVVITPEEERELKFPVREEQPPSRNFTPVQIAILFLQFCLVGVFLGAIIFNEPEEKEVASPHKVVVVTVERQRKAGGGYKYRLVAGKKGGIEAIILENLSSGDLPAISDDDEANEFTTAVPWMTTTDSPLKISAVKQQVSGPPQLSIAKDASMPSPPVPPPWSSTSSSKPLLSGANTKQQRSKGTPTTRPSFKFRYSKKDFYRG